MKRIQRMVLAVLIGSLLVAALVLVLTDTRQTSDFAISAPEVLSAGLRRVSPQHDQRSPDHSVASATDEHPQEQSAAVVPDGKPRVRSLPLSPSTDVGGLIEPGRVIAEQLKQIEEQIAPARLNYTRPSELAVGEQTIVAVGLTPVLRRAIEAADEQIANKLGVATEDLKKVTIRSTVIMIAELSGDQRAFEILRLHKNQRQTIVPHQITEWTWLVTALRPGEHDLNLSISAILRLQDAEEAIENSYTDRIRVRIDPSITAGYLISRYWLPLLLVQIAAGVGVGAWITGQLVFRHQRRKLAAALAQETPQEGQGYVFLSYSRRDERFAIGMASDLMRHGVRVWIDQREIKPGENWVAGIADGIEDTDALIVVLSRHALASEFVNQEVNSALQLGKPLFPVLHKTCQIPEALSQINAIDFRKDYQAALGRLIASLPNGGIDATIENDREQVHFRRVS